MFRRILQCLRPRFKTPTNQVASTLSSLAAPPWVLPQRSRPLGYLAIL